MKKNNIDQELLLLLQQADLERVSPKMEAFRKPYRIKLARGGRGAGAKSWSAASLLIQRAHREKINIACFREIQNSISESVYSLMCLQIERLRYPGWNIYSDHIISPQGGKIIFKGLKDLRAANQIKSLEGYNIFWLEEAQTISQASIDILLPTLRKEGSELWATYNLLSESDPINQIWTSDRTDVLRVDLLPGRQDNPWFPEVLQKEMELAYKTNPDLAEHIWGGQPLKQSEQSIFSRADVIEATRRQIEPDPHDVAVGVDVARFGDDRTVIYKRQGWVVTDSRVMTKKDTIQVALAAWDLANRDPSVPIVVDDTGVGGGVTDQLRRLGAKVVAVNFGAAAHDKTRYGTVADELWFELPINEIQIPADNELIQELTLRQYTYDKQYRRKIESKQEYKKRLGRSPDKADALLLTYYKPRSIIQPKYRQEMAARRRSGAF